MQTPWLVAFSVSLLVLLAKQWQIPDLRGVLMRKAEATLVVAK